MKLECEEPLSNFAFNFNLRRYSKDCAFAGDAPQSVRCNVCDDVYCATVRRYRLTVSKSELKARPVSALETKM